MYSQVQSRNVGDFVMEAWFRREWDRITNTKERNLYVDEVVKMMLNERHLVKLWSEKTSLVNDFEKYMKNTTEVTHVQV